RLVPGEPRRHASGGQRRAPASPPRLAPGRRLSRQFSAARRADLYGRPRLTAANPNASAEPAARRLPGGTGRLAGPAESHAGERSKDDAAAQARCRGARAPGRAGRACGVGTRLPARRAAPTPRALTDVGQGPEEETVRRRGAPDADERTRPAR